MEHAPHEAHLQSLLL